MTDSGQPGNAGDAVHPRAGASDQLNTCRADRDLYVAGRDLHLHWQVRPPVSWPHQVGVIPRQADFFQHRAVVGALSEAVSLGGTAVLCQVLAGTGGVGKTQLAAHYARHNRQDIDLLVWVTASSRESIIGRYAQAAAEVLGTDDGDAERAASAFLAWLEPKAPVADIQAESHSELCRWLIILDDLADPADLRGLWPPGSPLGRTLVTTRRRDAALFSEGRRRIDVGLFTEGEAVTFLNAILASHQRQEPADELAGVAEDLGCLPLALSQAAAYMVDTGRDCAAYRALLADHVHHLDDLLPEPRELPDDQDATVAAAFALSIDRANGIRLRGLAGPMLELIAMLEPSGIPAAVLASEPARLYLAERRTSDTDLPANSPAAFPGGPVPSEDAFGALRALHRLHLVDHSPATPIQAVQVHQLIQRTVIDGLPAGSHEGAAVAAADALAAAWPGTRRSTGASFWAGMLTGSWIARERDTGLHQMLRTNADSLQRVAGEALWRSGMHPVLLLPATSLARAGKTSAAADQFLRLADAAHERLGPDHPDTLFARYHLANVRGEAASPGEVFTDYQRLLPDYERVFGSDHSDTLVIRGNLADSRGEAGDPAGAAAEYERLLADHERIYGPDDLSTLGIRINLASWHGKAGDAVRASAEFEQLLADYERVLGPDHPDTLITRHNLAHWRGEAGDPARAVAEFHQLLADYERVLGADHPGAADARASLVMTLIHHNPELLKAGGTAFEADPLAGARALAFLARTNLQIDAGYAVPLLQDAYRLLAPDGVAEPMERVAVLDLLTRAYLSLGREDDAKESYAAARAILTPSMEEILAGEDFAALTAASKTLIEHSELELAGHALDRAKAVRLPPPSEGDTERRVLADLIHALARAREVRGAHSAALDRYREALGLVDAEADPRYYGVILHDIADAHRAQGDLDQAARLYQDAADYKIRGQSDPAVLATTFHALADTQQELGQPEDSVRTRTAQVLEADPITRALVLICMAGFHIPSDPERAVPLLDISRHVLAPEGIAEPADHADALDWLAKAYRLLGRASEAGAAETAARAILAGPLLTFITWPWNTAENSIADTAYQISGERVYIILNPGPDGLRFSRRLVRFTQAPDDYYPEDIPGQKPLSGRRRDRRPIVISMPCQEGSIEKISYIITQTVFSLIVKPATSRMKFRSSDIWFSRKLPDKPPAGRPRE